jgi:hypothetical protein
MKIRDHGGRTIEFNKWLKGFVSNSSSSSFLIIGTENDTLIDKMAKAKNMTREEIANEINFGQYDAGDIIFIGDHESVYFAGTDLSENEMDRLPLSIIKQRFAKKLKEKHNIDVPVKDIHMYYGEASS